MDNPSDFPLLKKTTIFSIMLTSQSGYTYSYSIFIFVVVMCCVWYRRKNTKEGHDDLKATPVIYCAD